MLIVALALGAWQPHASEDYTSLVAALHSPEPWVQGAAGTLLERAGPDVIPVLAKSLPTLEKSVLPLVRRVMLEVLLRACDRMVLPNFELADSLQPDLVEQVLGSFDEGSWQLLKARFGVASDSEKVAMLYAISRTGSRSVVLEEIVATAVRDSDSRDVRSAGVHAAFARGVSDTTASAVCNAISDEDLEVASLAATTFGKAWPAQDLRPLGELIQMLDGKDPECREVAVDCIGSLGQSAADALPALVRHVKQPGDLLFRRNVAACISRICRQAAHGAFAADLVDLLNDPDWAIRGWTAIALRRLGRRLPANLAGRLTALARDPRVQVRETSIRLLPLLAAAPNWLGTTLKELWEQSNPRSEAGIAVRRCIVASICDAGQLSEDSVQVLAEAVQAEDFVVRTVAGKGLVKLLSQADHVKEK
jgi:hypothetical protein